MLSAWVCVVVMIGVIVKVANAGDKYVPCNI